MPLPATATARNAFGFRWWSLGAVAGEGVGGQVQTGIAVEEVGGKGRRRDGAPSGLRKERWWKERAAARAQASFVQEKLHRGWHLFSTSTASTVLRPYCDHSQRH